MKVCFLVPDGTGLRNYLYSRVMDNFSPNDDVIVWTPLAAEVVEGVGNLHGRSIHYVKMELFREPWYCKLLKEAITYARLRHNTRIDANSTTMLNWTRKKYKGGAWLFYKIAALIGILCLNRYASIILFERWYDKLVGRTRFVLSQQQELKKMNVDVIFCTHQRSADAAAIVKASSLLGIPSIGAIYSWDNLPKARLLVKSDKYVVWSEYMRREMNRYYPEIPDRNIVVTGTPQFEFYAEREMYYSRDAFCKRLGLNPENKILCFSGNDLTFPCDDLYLSDLAESLMMIPESRRPQILLRRCPVDLSGRFDKVIDKYPDLIKVSEPHWKKYPGGWDAIVPTPDDVALLVNVCLHADAVINVGSTMAHDFAVFDKPAIYINYDQPDVAGWSAVINNQYQQFRSMPDRECVIWLDRKEDIVAAVQQALEHPTEVAISRQKWLETIVKHPLSGASENIARLCQHDARLRTQKSFREMHVSVN